jgi:CDP-diacylglycerol pyrophosphatase
LHIVHGVPAEEQSAMMRSKHWIAACFVGLMAGCAVPVRDPDVLWKIVHDQCVPHFDKTGMPQPCLEVKRDSGYAVLKDLRGIAQVLVIPTRRITGVEDPQVLAPDAAIYWVGSWEATRYVESLLSRRLPRESLSLAINSTHSRSQDQLHIHVDCLSIGVRDQLASAGAQIGDAWARLPQTIGGYSFHAMRLTALDRPGLSPFEAVARLPDAKRDMSYESIVVIGATFADGTPGYYLLATRDGPGEIVQDHDCAIAK